MRFAITSNIVSLRFEITTFSQPEIEHQKSMSPDTRDFQYVCDANNS